MGSDGRAVSPSLAVSVLALVLAVAGGAYAAGTINGANLKNRSVGAKKLKRNRVTGTEINESTLGQVPSAAHAADATAAADASRLAGKADTAYMGATVGKSQSTVQPGTLDGNTRYIDQACPPGTILLSGGPSGVSEDSIMVESSPAPGGAPAWRARIRPPAGGDNFKVIVLCAHR
jgi:FlaG/FlaF family flagellin (archaellin)